MRKSRKMAWARCIARMAEKGNTYKDLVRNKKFWEELITYFP
jgi:hypothetical protein